MIDLPVPGQAPDEPRIVEQMQVICDAVLLEMPNGERAVTVRGVRWPQKRMGPMGASSILATSIGIITQQEAARSLETEKLKSDIQPATETDLERIKRAR